MTDIFLSPKEVVWHTLVFGTTGVGRSGLLPQADVDQEFSKEQLVPHYPFKRNETVRENNTLSARDKAVREAYWTNSDMYEFHNIHDSCREYLDLDLTDAQVKAIFMAMPEDIIGSGLQHGFTDSVVRDDIGEYVRENADFIKSLVLSVDP